MGIQNQLNDVASDSIPLLFISLLATFIHHLRSLFLSLFPSPPPLNDAVFPSDLPSLVILSEQLRFHRASSFVFIDDSLKTPRFGGWDCVVCLCKIRHGELVRQLTCMHVFHTECFEGWLSDLNFNCPLCRSPLVSDQRVDQARRRVNRDLEAWFGVR